MALPLLLARFHALPWTGLLANLVAVPLAECLLAAAWLGGLLDTTLPGAGRIALLACEPLARGLRFVAAHASALPLALLPIGANAALPWLAGMGAGLLALALPGPRALDDRLRSRLAAGVWTVFGGVALGCALLGALAARPLLPPPGRWWLVAIDVGQGDALAVAGAGEWWLVDAGPRSPRWDAGEGAVLPFLRWAGVRRLARLVVTHDDGDHAGGANAIRRGVRVQATCAPAPRPGVPGAAGRLHARALGRGDRLGGWPRVRVLWPPWPGESGEGLARRGDNAAALVLELGEPNARAWLMADADSLVEAMLPPAHGLAVLKAGHHGSGSSSGAGFVFAASPARVLLSVGRRNAYGHPNAGALARLALVGARLDRTDQDGAIWYELDAHGARRLDWRAETPGRRAPVRRARPRASP